LAIANVLLGAGFVGIAFLHSWTPALIAAIVFGVGYGGLNLAQAILINESVTGERRRRLFSGLHAMYGLASLMAPLLATAMRAAGFDWRTTFFGLAALPLAFAVVSARWRGQSKVHLPEQRPKPLSKSEWFETVLHALILASYLWAEISVSTRLVLWLRREHGFSPELADNYLAGFFAMLLLGRVIFGAIGFQRFSNWTVLATSALLGSALYFAGLLITPSLLLLSGLAMAPFYPVCMDQVSRHFGAKSSQALGFVIGFGSGAVVVMHIAIGAIEDHESLTLALKVCATILGLLGLALAIHTVTSNASSAKR
jgi:fucose permease